MEEFHGRVKRHRTYGCKQAKALISAQINVARPSKNALIYDGAGEADKRQAMAGHYFLSIKTYLFAFAVIIYKEMG